MRGVFGREGEGADPVLVAGEGGLVCEGCSGGMGDVHGDERRRPGDSEDERRPGSSRGPGRKSGEGEGEGVEFRRGREGLEMGDRSCGGIAGRDAVHGDGPVGGGRGEDVGLASAGRNCVNRARPRALFANPHGCKDGRTGGPRPDADALVYGAADEDSGGGGGLAGEEADGIDAVGVALERGVDAVESGVLRGRRGERETWRGMDDVARTSGLHKAMQRPAPKARRPHGDQSAAAGWRFAPTAMSGQDIAAMAAVGER